MPSLPQCDFMIQQQGLCQSQHSPCLIFLNCVKLRVAKSLLSTNELFELREEVVALVINEDEGREVFYTYFPYGFHAEFWVFHTLDTLDVA